MKVRNSSKSGFDKQNRLKSTTNKPASIKNKPKSVKRTKGNGGCK